MNQDSIRNSCAGIFCTPRRLALLIFFTNLTATLFLFCVFKYILSQALNEIPILQVAVETSCWINIQRKKQVPLWPRAMKKLLTDSQEQNGSQDIYKRQQWKPEGETER